ncbi:MAG TPA: sigma 54-interacting transcriptional regulator [Pyrinomonadaceae bacterium]|nr:sigma 54-interacting transcriptional regulator [Pyrinomonadaceae bacterium]
MKPRLVVIAGKLQGTVVPITDSPAIIGRESAATLYLAEGSVSRKHSQIVREGDDFILTDLDSLNGTFVNDVPVKRRTLEHGDKITIGTSHFLFLRHDGDIPSESGEVQFVDSQSVTGSTVRFRLNEALYVMARDLAALIKVSTTINAIRGLLELQKKLLDLMFEVVPAQHGAILLTDGSDEEFSSVFALDRVKGPDETIKVSRTVARQVLRDGTALLIEDRDKTVSLNYESLKEARTSSVLCVPLIMAGRSLGVLYLASNEPDVHFDSDHLQLASTIAAIAAVAIENARHIEWLESENKRLIADAGIEHSMVGESPRMRQVYQLIAKVAPTDSSVLISGESGTGKELVARAIHQNSKRSGKPFIAVNCAALTETLLESELFGHEKGAFTGALAQRKGRLEIADGGTLFLDEIGELSAPLQVKLLRVLQEREFERVGGSRTIKVDIRLLTATNRNLEDLISQGLFRQDLFYRLNVLKLEMPPLRQRQEDIPLLSKYFAVRYGEKVNRKITSISPEAQKRLLSYDWPGNVRELENAIERAVVLGTTDVILPEDLPEVILETETRTMRAPTKYHEAVAETKKQIILQAMDQTKGNYTDAAKLLGVHPNYLHRLITNLNLREHLKR